MLIGYVRVSKADGSQSSDLQRDALLAVGIEAANIYEDRASGRSDARLGLEATLKALRSGDVLVVWKLDRLGRNLRHLVNTIHDLTQRGIGFKVLTGQGAAIDTTKPAGKLIFGIFAALAEFERELISERTKAGLASARARGRNGGAPPSDVGYEPSRNPRWRSLPRDWRNTSDALSPRWAGRIAPARWAQAPQTRGNWPATPPARPRQPGLTRLTVPLIPKPLDRDSLQAPRR
jgi:DNA invertase Pin-like site-specific DNA recombinase